MPLPPLHAAPRMLEADVSGQVCDFLRMKGWRLKRNQRTVIPGQFQSGEPGEADVTAIYYLGSVRPGLAAVLHVEVKGPRDKRACNCAWRLKANKRGKCGVCLQADWQARERSRGATVWVVNNFVDFEENYQRAFGWLHSGAVPGQIELGL